ncbi:MAG: hypothetical protein HZA46_19725, partial [Planctomycetales bacterium]|nr:hypothetical protein [Planctomycetales bacterium]
MRSRKSVFGWIVAMLLTGGLLFLPLRAEEPAASKAAKPATAEPAAEATPAGELPLITSQDVLS